MYVYARAGTHWWQRIFPVIDNQAFLFPECRGNALFWIHASTLPVSTPFLRASGKGGKKKRNEWVTNGWRSCREWVCPDASLIDGKRRDWFLESDGFSIFVNVSYVVSYDGVMEWRDWRECGEYFCRGIDWRSKREIVEGFF